MLTSSVTNSSVSACLQDRIEVKNKKPQKADHLFALSKSSFSCSSSRMYFWSCSLIALVCAKSSSSAEICLYPSECCISIFSYSKANQTAQQVLNNTFSFCSIVRAPWKAKTDALKIFEKCDFIYGKMPTNSNSIAHILLGCQQTRALPVTPYQPKVLGNSSQHSQHRAIPSLSQTAWLSTIS